MQWRSPTAILTATIAAAMLVVANVSVLNVALPELSLELGATQAQGQWMIDIYAVVLAALLLPIGAIGDKVGRRFILLVGLGIIVVANLVTILLDTPTQLIIARAVSGLGAAFVFPATLSTITATMPDERRSQGVAMWTAAVSIGGMLGVLASGALIENFWWGSLFLSMAIAAAVVLVVCAIAVPDSSDPDDANLDPVGAVLSAVGIGALVLGIIEGPVKGWTSAITLGGLIVGGLALVSFVVWEMRTARPLLDVKLFRRPGTRAGSLSVFIQFTGMFGMFFLVVFYLAVVQGLGPLDTGLALMPIAIGLFPATAMAIPMARRFGRRAVGACGLLILGGGFAFATTIGVDSPLRQFFVALIIMGFGVGLASPPATDAIVESLPPAQQGVASALNDVLRELGAAIGIAVAGSAFNAAYRSSVGDLETALPDQFELIQESPFAALQIGLAAPAEVGGTIIGTVQQATIDGWSRSMIVLAGVAVAGAACFVWWAPRHRSEASDAAEPGSSQPWPPAPEVRPTLAALRRDYAMLQHDLEVLTLRAALPPDMPTWPMDEQFSVAGKAAAAMDEPLRELEVLAHGLVGLAGTARNDVATVVAQSWPSDLIHEDVVAISGASARCIRLVDELHRRFAQVASTLPQLIGVAGRFEALRASVAEAELTVSAWVGLQAPLDLTLGDTTPARVETGS